MNEKTKGLNSFLQRSRITVKLYLSLLSLEQFDHDKIEKYDSEKLREYNETNYYQLFLLQNLSPVRSANKLHALYKKRVGIQC